MHDGRAAQMVAAGAANIGWEVQNALPQGGLRSSCYVSESCLEGNLEEQKRVQKKAPEERPKSDKVPLHTITSPDFAKSHATYDTASHPSFQSVQVWVS